MEVLAYIEENWEELKNTLGKKWENFYEEFKEIVSPLEDNENLEKLFDAIEKIGSLLFSYGLEQNFMHFFRKLPTGSETLSKREEIKGISNRFVALTKGKKSESKRTRG